MVMAELHTDDWTRDPNPDEQFRARVRDAIPDSYSPVVHVLATTAVGAATVAFAAWRLANPTPLELFAIPVTFVVANAVEWRAHKGLLHRRTKPLQELYDRHTPQHHRMFRYEDMAIRAPKELKMVLIPAVGVAAIVAAAVPMAVAASAVFGTNVGMLFLMTAGTYVVSYELSHMIYHLPEDSLVGRLPLVRFLREHHARHHDPRLMQKWNFNVTVPLWDWVRGTIAPKDLVERVRRKVKGEPAPAA